jgi:restriction endonuclease S subunit
VDNKVFKVEYFITYLKDIEGRIDPHYYREDFVAKKTTLSSVRFRIYPLGKLITDISGGATPKLGEGHYTDDKSGVPFLRVQNISESGLVLDDLKYVRREIHDTLLKRSQLKAYDLVFTITGRIGNVSVIPKGFEGNINQHSVRFHLKAKIDETQIIPEYVAIYLNSNLGNTLSVQGATGGTRPALDYGRVKSIQIPIPPTEIQNKIIDMMQSAYQSERLKEAEAQKLLDSIDDYLLGELRINISYKPQLTFITYSNQVKERLDSLYHCQDIYYFLNGYQGNTTKLGDCIEYTQSGFAAGYNNQDTDGNGILQIRPTNISDDRRLIFDRNIYVKQKAVEKQPGDILVKGEVLFNNTNSQELVGKSVVFNLDGQYFCSNHITRIQVKESALVNDYLAAILNLYQRRGVFYRICTNWNNQSGVNIELLKTVRIPLPTPEVQRGISSEIRYRMSQANELQQQAKVEVEKAKVEVEKIILGEQSK